MIVTLIAVSLLVVWIVGGVALLWRQEKHFNKFFWLWMVGVLVLLGAVVVSTTPSM